MTERWDAECSLLAHLVAAENGEPLRISEADMMARFRRRLEETRAAKGWKEKHRVEAVKIEAALDAMGRWLAREAIALLTALSSRATHFVRGARYPIELA